jgi:hypothetical protein
MDELYKKLEELQKAIKAVKKLNPPVAPKLPELPSIKAPPQPSMTPASTTAPKIGAGKGPDSKKDPKKIAEQIKNGSMSTKGAKTLVAKADSQTGQWYLEPTEPSDI